MLALIQPPAADVLSLDEVKDHLRVDHDDEDNRIRRLIEAAVNMIDPAAGGWLGRALRPQTWELRLPGFCGDERVIIPIAALISIDSVKYDDAAGVQQTVPADTYRIVGAGSLGLAAIVMNPGNRWPAVRFGDEAVRIRFTCGYPMPVGDAVDTLPAPIRQWLLLKIGSLYKFREDVLESTAGAATSLPAWVEQMIAPYRIYS